MARANEREVRRPEDWFPPARPTNVPTSGEVDADIAAALADVDINTTAPLTGGGNLSADRTLEITPATGAAAGSMSAADKTKLDAISGTNTGDQTSIVGITGTKVEFNAAVTDGNFLYEDDLSTAAYGIGWNASNKAPTQNAVYDKIETLQPLDADLTAIAALATTAFGRDHLVLADAPALRAKAGLGTAAVKNTGTSGDAVPVCNGAAVTWAGGATFGGSLNVTGLVDATSTIVARNGAIQSDVAAGSAAFFRMSHDGTVKGYIALGGAGTDIFWNIDVAGGTHQFQVAGTVEVTINNAGIDLAGGNVLKVGGTQVVGAQQSAITDDASGAANQATVNEILAALRAHGLITT